MFLAMREVWYSLDRSFRDAGRVFTGCGHFRRGRAIAVDIKDLPKLRFEQQIARILWYSDVGG
jgi:hypothetical protein